MPVVPDKKIERIQFFQSRLPQLTTNAVAIGSTTTDVGNLSTKTQAARDAYDDQQAATTALKDAQIVFQNAVAAMSAQGAAIIKQVRAKADITNNPNVYALAGIPVPATPSTRDKPGTPTALKTTLNPNGSIELAFKCKNPAGTAGTIYHVYRSLTGAPGSYEYLGGNGKKTFTDATCPAGVPMAYYSIQAIRSTSVGTNGEFIVKFGSAAGPVVVNITQSPKLAA